MMHATLSLLEKLNKWFKNDIINSLFFHSQSNEFLKLTWYEENIQQISSSIQLKNNKPII